MSDKEDTCEICGNDPKMSAIGRDLGFRPDIAFAEVRKLIGEKEQLQAQLSAAQASVEDLKKAAKPTAAEAYQVIGALAEEAGLFDKPGVQQALDYFSDIANCGKTHRCRAILPWGIDGVEEQPEGGE